MNTHGTWAYVTVVAALLAGGIAARADSLKVTAHYLGDSPTEIVGINSPYLPAPYNSGMHSFYTGASQFHLDSLTSNGNIATDLSYSQALASLGGASGNFVGFCIDLHHLISPGGPYVWNIGYLTNVTSSVNGLGISQDQANAISHLWGSNTFNTAASAATFQMALWDIIYNTPPSSPGGSFTESAAGAFFSGNSNKTAADAMAGDAWTHRNDAGNSAPVYALISADAHQSFSITIVGGAGSQNIAPVPLPASAGVGFSMLGGFGLMFAFRKQLSWRPRIAG